MHMYALFQSVGLFDIHYMQMMLLELLF